MEYTNIPNFTWAGGGNGHDSGEGSDYSKQYLKCGSMGSVSASCRISEDNGIQ